MPDVTINVPDELMAQLETEAASQLRTPENLILWIITWHYAIPGTPPTGIRPGRPGRPAALPTTPLHTKLLTLYNTAGKPTMLSLRENTSLSRMTFSNTLFHGHLPTWDKLQTIIRALGGDPAEYQQLWEDAHQAQREQRTAARKGRTP